MGVLLLVVGAVLYFFGCGFTYQMANEAATQRRAWLAAGVWPATWAMLAGMAVGKAVERLIEAKAKAGDP